jgi:hypothetical protein
MGEIKQASQRGNKADFLRFVGRKYWGKKG